MGVDNGILKMLGERIKMLRNQKHITREQLAEKIDVSTRFLADVEAGKVGVSLGTLKNICNALYTTADYLLGLAEHSHKEQLIIATDMKLKNLDTRQLENLNKIIDAFVDTVKQS